MELINLHKYVGLWYEIDKFQQNFEKSCSHATAMYNLKTDGNISVENVCYNENWVPIRKINGTARQIDNNKFNVSFEGIPTKYNNYHEANYIILATDYINYSVVGSENKNSLWILSRRKYLDIQIYKDIVNLCKELGYDISKLSKNH